MSPHKPLFRRYLIVTLGDARPATVAIADEQIGAGARSKHVEKILLAPCRGIRWRSQLVMSAATLAAKRASAVRFIVGRIAVP